MNWRGILGIYAGLAIVLAGGWFWLQSGALWALGLVVAGLVVAALGVAYIVIKRRGPRPAKTKAAKSPKAPRAARTKTVSDAEDDEANSVAKARMAMIAERAARLAVVNDEPAENVESVESIESIANVDQSGSVDHVAPVEVAPLSNPLAMYADVMKPVVVSEAPVQAEAAAAPLVDEVQPLDPQTLPPGAEASGVPDLTGTRVWSATLDAPLVTKRIVTPDVAAEPDPVETATPAAARSWPPDPEPTPEWGSGGAAATVVDAEPAAYEPEAAPEPEAPAAPEPVAMVAVARTGFGPTALDSLPGFPWTARFIGIWAREVRFACPEPLRDAVVHWQRWADGQDARSPLIEEAAAEFNAMLDVWRESGEDVLGISSDDWTAEQLAAEASEDAALAALLPEVLRAQSVAAE